jgi:hypothetical protein
MREPNTIERAYIWCSFAGLGLLFAGLVVAGLFPPPSPNRTADEFAEFYRDNTNSFRVGTQLMGFGGALIVLWMAVIARRLHAIEGHGPATAYAFLGLGSLLMFQIVMPIAIGQVVAFRPERPASDTEALNDLFFLQLISPAYLFFVQLAATGIAILADRSAQPAFPRWVGYVNLWAAAGSFSGVMAIFFKTGPWAWNGLFAFWIPAVVFGVWVIAMGVPLLIRQIPAFPLTAPPVGAERSTA